MKLVATERLLSRQAVFRCAILVKILHPAKESGMIRCLQPAVSQCRPSFPQRVQSESMLYGQLRRGLVVKIYGILFSSVSPRSQHDSAVRRWTHYRGNPRSPAGGLRSNEESVALTILKPLVLSPHRHPAGEQCSTHCGKVHRRHRHPVRLRERVCRQARRFQKTLVENFIRS
jgi:hypothetical protein